MSKMTDVIAAHRAAWQTFQDAPTDEANPETMNASFSESEAMFALLRTIPTNQHDLRVLKDHLDWWVVEEDQRRGLEPELFALHAAINLASGTRANFTGNRVKT